MTTKTDGQGGEAAPYAYLLMRTDMPSLGLGKSRAQSMHAGNAMTFETYVMPLAKGEKPDERVVRWHAEACGFGTAIAIGARDQVTRAVIEQVMGAARALDFLHGTVIDPSYPYMVDGEIYPLIDPKVHTEPAMRTRDGWRCFREELTGAWLLGDKRELEVLLARFDLTPHHEEDRGRS